MANVVSVTIKSVTQRMPKMYDITAQAEVKDSETSEVLFTASATAPWKDHLNVAAVQGALIQKLQNQINKWKAELAAQSNQVLNGLGDAIAAKLKV